MTAEQREELIRLLQQGEDISPEWAPILFPPEKREYELVFHGKERNEDLLANRLALPLQPVRAFSNSQLGGCARALVYHGLDFPQVPPGWKQRLRAVRGTAIHQAFPGDLGSVAGK